jgi:hypothetical protein
MDTSSNQLENFRQKNNKEWLVGRQRHRQKVRHVVLQSTKGQIPKRANQTMTQVIIHTIGKIYMDILILIPP